MWTDSDQYLVKPSRANSPNRDLRSGSGGGGGVRPRYIFINTFDLWKHVLDTRFLDALLQGQRPFSCGRLKGRCSRGQLVESRNM